MGRSIHSNSLRLFCRCHPVTGLWLILGTASGWLQSQSLSQLREASSFRPSPSIPTKTAGTAATAPVSISSSMKASSSSSSLLSSSSLEQEPQQLLEVEEKFAFSNRSKLEERLRQEGFEPVQEITMVDWYFDRYGTSELELPLIRNDHWLRFRQVTSQNGIDCDEDGEWQLKRGTIAGKDGGGGATVYEEIEGLGAVKIACSIAHEQSNELTDAKEISHETPMSFEGNSVPVLPISGCRLQPFAQIVTQRSKWKQQQQKLGTTNTIAFSNLVVDLDTTPDGFAVGEVEALIDASSRTEEQLVPDAAEITSIDNHQDEAVAQAREDIRQLLARILDHERRDDGGLEQTRRRPPMGKLEQFLFRKQPRIYKVCVESGVIPESPPSEASS